MDVKYKSFFFFNLTKYMTEIVIKFIQYKCQNVFDIIWSTQLVLKSRELPVNFGLFEKSYF